MRFIKVESQIAIVINFPFKMSECLDFIVFIDTFLVSGFIRPYKVTTTKELCVQYPLRH